MKSLPGVCARIVIVTKRHEAGSKAIDKRSRTSLQCTAHIQDIVCTKNVRDVTDDSLKEYDIICISAPTEGFSAPRLIKEFLKQHRQIGTIAIEAQ